MNDAEFAAFLEQCRSELTAKRTRFMESANGQAWHYDLEAAVMTIGNENFSVSVVGSFCPSRSTWLWGWANDTFSEPVRSRSSRFKSLYSSTGFRVFVEEGIRATRRDAEDFTAMAVHGMSNSG